MIIEANAALGKIFGYASNNYLLVSNIGNNVILDAHDWSIEWFFDADWSVKLISDMQFLSARLRERK